MPTDEDDQDGHFFYNHPERGVYFAPRRAQPLLLLFRSTPPLSVFSTEPIDRRAVKVHNEYCKAAKDLDSKYHHTPDDETGPVRSVFC